MESLFYPSNDGKTTIHACIWQPEGHIKGVVQIIHGMAEYAERYSDFANYLTKNGYLVCADDHLGHGKSVTSDDNLGYFVDGNGESVVLADIRKLTELIKEKVRELAKGGFADAQSAGDGVPYFILGHSMGSFFARKYIAEYGKELSGAVIMGTGFQPAIVTGVAKFLTRTVALFKGWHHRSKFINDLAFGSYNKKFEGKTEYDWLSQNENNVQNYINDKLCGVLFTCSGFYGLFSVLSDACKSKTINATPKNLPIYLVAGKEDPVGNYGKSVVKLYDKMNKVGIKDVSMTLYANCRHEILNDINSQQVMQDIVDFFNSKIKST